MSRSVAAPRSGLSLSWGATRSPGSRAGCTACTEAISDRVFRYVRYGVGPAVAPVRALHDGIADGVYGPSGRWRTIGRVAAVRADWPGSGPVGDPARGGPDRGRLGLIGDQLEGQGSPFAADPVTVRVDGPSCTWRRGRRRPGGWSRGGVRRCRRPRRGAAARAHRDRARLGMGGLDAEDYGVRLAVDPARRRCTCGTTPAGTSATRGATWPTSWSGWSGRGPCRSPTSR